MSMNPAMKAALQAMNPTLVHLVEVQFADRTVRLTDGGDVFWDGNWYRAEDSELGALNGFSEFSETEGTESPRQEVYFEYKTNTALTRLATPSAQGTPVVIMAAAISRTTGTVIGAPDILFNGVIDSADLRHAKGNRMLTVSLSTPWELLFDNDEGLRWDNATWTDAYGPNARAFYAVTDVTRKLYWGYKGPSNGSGGGYSSGGGGFIGGGGGDMNMYNEY